VRLREASAAAPRSRAGSGVIGAGR